MSRPVRNIVGRKYGRLTVISFHGMDRGNAVWNCICDCGNKHKARSSPLGDGSITSCGCRHKELMASWGERVATHGMSRNSAEYRTWTRMKSRCCNPEHKRYKDWGGRGITVCARWLVSFENFYADMGNRPHGRSLDRINNEEGYSPENCRWATSKEQAENKRPKIPKDQWKRLPTGRPKGTPWSAEERRKRGKL